MSTVVMTRKQYMDGYKGTDAERTAQHRAYYAQFVTPEIRTLVANTIGIDRLKQSRDPYFNDIPLDRWDAMAGCEQRGGAISLSDAICTLKEAARQLVESGAGVESDEVSNV